MIQNCNYTDIIITGDFNCDFERKTKFVELIEGKTFTSTIDHFFWNNKMTSIIDDAGVLHPLENLSDHEPIYCTITMTYSKEISTKQVMPQSSNADWKNATEADKDEFFKEVASKLADIDVPNVISCKNVRCDCKEHRKMMDDYLIDILASFEQSAKEKLPETGVKRVKKLTIPK